MANTFLMGGSNDRAFPVITETHRSGVNLCLLVAAATEPAALVKVNAICNELNDNQIDLSASIAFMDGDNNAIVANFSEGITSAYLISSSMNATGIISSNLVIGDQIVVLKTFKIATVDYYLVQVGIGAAVVVGQMNAYVTAEKFDSLTTKTATTQAIITAFETSKNNSGISFVPRMIPA